MHLQLLLLRDIAKLTFCQKFTKRGQKKFFDLFFLAEHQRKLMVVAIIP